MASHSPVDGAPQPARRFSLESFSLDRLSLESWAVAVAVIFVLLVVVGVFPRVPW
jgi:Tfp pilus assembly protein PilO